MSELTEPITDQIDPTKNVKDLSDASNKRQDDLRVETNIRIDAEIRHVKEMMHLRAEHAREINLMEAGRLNALRQVDGQNVKTAEDRAQTAISALAATTQANAENLRTALTNTAATIATQFSVTVSGINERLAALEKSSYEGAGRQTYSDPAFLELVAQMKSLTEYRAGNSGQREGSQALWGYLLGAVALVSSLIAIFVK